MLIALPAAYALFALLIWGANSAIVKLGREVEPKVLVRLRWCLWLLALLVLETAFVGFINWLECYWQDVQVWNYLNGWLAVGLFVGLNFPAVSFVPASRSGGGLLLRLCATLLLSLYGYEFLTLASESWMIREHAAAGVDPATLYFWAGGSNPRLGSHGLADYAARTFDGWLGGFTNSLGFCAYFLPILFFLEWLRTGVNPMHGFLKQVPDASGWLGV